MSKEKQIHAAWGISGKTICGKKIGARTRITRYGEPINCKYCLTLRTHQKEQGE